MNIGFWISKVFAFARQVLTSAIEILCVATVAQRTRVIGGLFLAGVLEVLGLAMIVPLLAISADLRGGKTGLVEVIEQLFDWSGLPFTLISLTILIICFLSLKAVVSIAVMRYVGVVTSGITRDYRVKLIHGLLAARWQFFIRQPLGRLAHAAGQEVSAISETFLCLAEILAASLQLMAYGLVAALISWKFFLIALGISVLMFSWFGALVGQTRTAAREYRGKVRQMVASFTDAMVGIKPIRAMGRARRFSELFERDARDLETSFQARVVLGEFSTEIQEPIIGGLLMIGFLMGTTYFDLAFHEIMIMSIVFLRMLGTVSTLQRNFYRLLPQFDQFKMLQTLAAKIAEAAEHSGSHLKPSLQHGIRFEYVRFSYGEKDVLEDASFEIPVGRITALIGPSGAGKSTVIDLIAGLYRPVSGRILVDGVDLAELDLQAWRRMIGYAPQEVTLFHDTILRNVTLWEETLSEGDAMHALRAAGAADFVSEMPGGLNYVVGERGHGLSGGQRQRLSIARALVHKPALLILDEATTGLDPETEEQVCSQIRTLVDKTGLTVLVVSHQPRWQTVADCVIWVGDKIPASADGTLPIEIS